MIWTMPSSSIYVVALITSEEDEEALEEHRRTDHPAPDGLQESAGHGLKGRSLR